MNDKAGITSTSNTSHEEMKQTALKRDEEYDLTRFAFQGCFGIHVFNCFQF
jgi:hypothetical protein